MNEFFLAVFYGLVAGSMIPVGGAIASIEHIRPGWLETEFRHNVMAFGGGVLIAAATLVLIPQGAANLAPAEALAAFAAGGILFALVEHRGRRRQSRPQLWAMLTDFLPEAMALGAMLGSGSEGAELLALLIGAQNLPEGFNAYRELLSARKRPSERRLLLQFGLLGLLGPLAAAAGYIFLSANTDLTSMIMMTAAGGILFLMFQDIAPQAHMRNRLSPSLSAIGGFGFGLFGQMILG